MHGGRLGSCSLASGEKEQEQTEPVARWQKYVVFVVVVVAAAIVG
jgi:hypothetical protein